MLEAGSPGCWHWKVMECDGGGLCNLSSWETEPGGLVFKAIFCQLEQHGILSRIKQKKKKKRWNLMGEGVSAKETVDSKAPSSMTSCDFSEAVLYRTSLQKQQLRGPHQS